MSLETAGEIILLWMDFACTKYERDNLVVVHNNRPKIIVIVQCLFNRIARRAFRGDAIAKCNIVVIE